MLFIDVLKEMIELRFEKLALGSLSPLMIDDMIREKCYYFNKIYRAQQKMGIDTPNLPFDPTQNQIEK